MNFEEFAYSLGSKFPNFVHLPVPTFHELLLQKFGKTTESLNKLESELSEETKEAVLVECRRTNTIALGQTATALLGLFLLALLLSLWR